MKLFKMTAWLIGAFALIVGVSSCDDEESNECCTFTETDTYNGVTESYTIRACEDGSVTYTYSDGTTDTDSWKGDYGTWAEVKSDLQGYGANCG